MSKRKAPRLNRQLVLEARVKQPDGAGGYAESWESLGTVWASLVARAGRAAGRKTVAVSRVDYRVTLRAALVGAAARPIAGQRFREGTRSFRILSVTEADADGRYLECIAREEAVA